MKLEERESENNSFEQKRLLEPIFLSEHHTAHPIQWHLILVTAVAVMIGTILVYSLLNSRSAKQISDPIRTSNPAVTKRNVAALGRLEPAGEIVRLSAPNSVEGSRIDRVYVQEGDLVRTGQVIAVLDNQPSRAAALKKALSQMAVSQAKLVQVKAGAKTGDISAQQATVEKTIAELNGGIATQEATIGRISAEVKNSIQEYERYLPLYQQGAITKSDLDSKKLRLETAQEQLSEAKAALAKLVDSTQAQERQARATLDSVAEVRSVDVEVAQTEVDSAIAAVEQAKAELSLTYIRAPMSGKILKLYTKAGEVIDRNGIAELGRTSQMYVVAEVYETDVKNLKIGQTASITSEAFSGTLKGVVDKIGLRVKKQDIFDVNPMANTDFKVVEVKIQLNPSSSRQVSGFSNLQVRTVIDTQS